MLTFTTVDFETANPKRSSVCQVGMVRVVDSQIVDEYATLVRPERSVSYFHDRNVAVHGIRFGQVRRAPYWDEIYAKVRELAGTDPLVAHNVPFDRSAMTAVCELYGMPVPANPWACTLRLSRKLLPGLTSHRLPIVTAELGIDAFTHHDALDDARAAAHLAIALAERFDSCDLR